MPFGFSKHEDDARGEGPRPFKVRLGDFWRWFGSNEQRLFDAHQTGSFDANELSEKIDTVAPGLAWELCPSPDEGREGLALSSEGSGSIRLLVDAMIDAAPPLERWTLFASKQPYPGIAEATVELDNGLAVEFAAFRFAVSFDPESERLEIRTHHPRFSEISASARSRLMFIALDNALGEALVESWVGPVEATPEWTPDHEHGIDELLRQARAALERHDLDPDLDRSKLGSIYRRDDVGDGDLEARADVFTGRIRTMEPLRQFSDPDAEDPLAESGACLAYVMFPAEIFEAGQEAIKRGEIEDRLGASLEADALGCCIGGALGRQYGYIDLLLFDEPAAIERLREVLPEIELVPRASLRFFAPERREEHVVLLAPRN